MTNILFPLNAAPEEILAFACDRKSDRLDMARLFNEVNYVQNLTLMFSVLLVHIHWSKCVHKALCMC